MPYTECSRNNRRYKKKVGNSTPLRHSFFTEKYINSVTKVQKK